MGAASAVVAAVVYSSFGYACEPVALSVRGTGVSAHVSVAVAFM